jgi:serine protease
MYTRPVAVLAALGLAGLAASAQQPQVPTGTAGSRQRIHDVPTPGRLGGLRTESAPRISIPSSGSTYSPPDGWGIDPATGAEYRSGEVLVRFRLGVSAALRARALQRARGERVLRTLPGDWSLVRLEAGIPAMNALGALRDGTEVLEATLNFRRRTRQFRPNDEFYDLQWNFGAINLPLAWQINPGARNDIVVAVLDTGLNTVTDTFVFSSPIVGQIPARFAAVPDLVTDDRIVGPRDFVYDDELPVDLDGHGTHVAGTIAQQTNNNIGVAGVAYNVKLMPLKVLFGSWDAVFAPGNPGGDDATIADAIRYAADNDARVINLSLGGFEPAPVLRDAISYAVSRGAFVAIAAGNSGDEGNPVEYPASYAAEINGAMAVGAVNRDLRRAVYSGFHPYVEICAPGGEQLSALDYERGITQIAYDDLETLSFLPPLQLVTLVREGFRPRFDQFEPRPASGTSMATPHIAGVAALLYSQGIRNPAAIEEAIGRFARSIDATSDECGAGLVDARRALRGFGLAR